VNKSMRRALRIILLVAALLPLVSALLWTFVMRWPLNQKVPVFTLNSWRLLKAGDMRSLWESIVNSAASALAAIVAATAAARVLLFFPKRLAALFEAFFLSPALAPALCVVIAFHESAVFFFGPFLLFPRFVLYVFFSFPYAFMIVYSAYCAEMRPLMEEAALTGAGETQIFFYIERPLMARHFETAFVFSYSAAYGLYLIEAFFKTGSKAAFSIQMAEYLQNSSRSSAAVYTVVYIAAGLAVLLLSRLLSLCVKSRALPRSRDKAAVRHAPGVQPD
jgi:ABC-type spermidine/putrescine transport system permease subunit II